MTVELAAGDRLVVVRYRDAGAAPQVGDLAAELGLPVTTGLLIDGRPVAADVVLAASGLADGSQLALPDPGGQDGPGAPPWRLWVVGGTGTGRSWPMPAGSTLVGGGPAADVVLDPGPDGPVTIHLSADGTVTAVDVGGERTVAAGTPFAAAGRLLSVSPRPAAPARPSAGTTIPVRPTHGPTERHPSPPAPPTGPQPPAPPPPLSVISAVAPLVVGGVVALLWSPRFALFAALGPVLAVGTWLEQKRRHRRARTEHEQQMAAGQAEHRRAVADHEAESAGRDRRRLPPLPDLVERARAGGPGLWTSGVEPIASPGWDDDRPVPVDLLGRTIVITGPDALSLGVVRHLVIQLAVAIPPGELHLAADHDLGRLLPWTGWLPHRLAPAGCEPARVGLFTGGALPDEPPAADEAQLVLLQGGQEPPPWSATSIVVRQDGRGRLEHRDARSRRGGSRPLLAAALGPDEACEVARHLARWRPVAARGREPPPEVTVDLTRVVDDLDDVDLLLRRWSRSTDTDRGASLAAPIGMDAAGVTDLDLVGEGPHAVIGGTTGSGKSELLQTLVTSLCAHHPPETVNLVLVDYKGGSAFDACLALPQVATVVTDLDGTRTDRVLIAVDAELTRRERWLRSRDRPDLQAAADQAGRPPRLVVVIDEFATLARDRPEFLPALVDVARRGRSLGLHLVLATQRPAGAMTDDIRANTDVRIALRTLDRADSVDLIGGPDAVTIPADRPGRGAMRRAGGAVELFQTATVTTPGDPSNDAELVVWPIDGPAEAVGAAPGADDGPSPAERVVQAATEGLRRSGRAPAQPLWPPELPATLPPGDLRRHPRAHGEVAIGLVDDLTATTHRPCTWTPARGVLALAGTLGAGVAAVATGVVTAAQGQLGPHHVYAADGSGELGGWCDADPVAAVVAAADRDAVRRLVDRLEREVRRRRAEPGDRPPVLLVLHEHAALSAALDDLDGLRLLDRLHRVVADGPRHEVTTLVTGPRPGALPPVVSGVVERRLVLHVAGPDDYRLVGLRPPSPALPPGRALDEHGNAVQLVELEPNALEGATRTARRDRPRPLEALPAIVATGALGPSRRGDPWLVPVGVDHDGAVALPLAGASATVVAGPPGSGRSTALRTIAAGVEQRGGRVLGVGPAAGRRHGPLDGFGATSVGDLLGLASAVAAPSVADQVLIVVDDATEVDDVDGVLLGLARGRLRPSGVRVLLAIDPVERRTGYGHWTSSLRPARTGIALHHDADDADLWAALLPPTTTGPRPPGRGLLLVDGADPLELQVARP